MVGTISGLRPACSLTAAPAVANAITFAPAVVAPIRVLGLLSEARLLRKIVILMITEAAL
jgi:hypothetical protein